MNPKYERIRAMKRPVSQRHPPMAMENRAAQFSPFAALTGYEDAVNETARWTGEASLLDEDRLALLNSRLTFLASLTGEPPEVTVTYFRPDEKKAGGAYATVTGAVRKIDALNGIVSLTDGTRIPIESITAIAGDVFPAEDF